MAPTTTFRKVLLTLLIVSACASTFSAGTFAAVTASVTNDASAFGVGSLVLSNKKATQTACLSTGAGTNPGASSSQSCDALFSTGSMRPGHEVFVDLTLANAGNGTGTLWVHATGCIDTNATSNAGNGSPCGTMQLSIQEYAPDSAGSDTNRAANNVTGGTCLYGGGTSNACAFSSTKTLTDFATTYSSTSALSAGAHAVSGAAVGKRYFRVAVRLPSSASDGVQGRTASFGLTWTLN